MKKINFICKFFLLLPVYIFLLHSETRAAQSNFQIAPSPIAYPFFEADRYDGTLGGSLIKISTADLTLAGGAGDFKGRWAVSEFAAMDVNFGLNMLGGTMPGIPPITPLYTSSGYLYYTQVAGDSTLTLFSFRMAFNMEFQPVKSEFGSIIFFGGPNMNFSKFTITTPFNLIVPPPHANAGTVFKGYSDTLAISTSLTGWQAGIQLDIPLGGDMRLSPFFMYSTFSGSATLTDTTTVSSSGFTTMTFDIPEATSTSVGMDIIFGEYSIGTLLQQMAASDNTAQDTSIIVLSVSYHFSSEDNKTAGENEKREANDFKPI